MREFILYCDGAARGNPGPAAYGYIIFENDQTLAEAGECLGIATNNVAEYEGLIQGLEHCIALGANSVVIRTDSELIAKQLRGEYKVRSPHLLPLYQRAKTLLSRLEKGRIEHVRRHLNKEADALANKALDKKM